MVLVSKSFDRLAALLSENVSTLEVVYLVYKLAVKSVYLRVFFLQRPTKAQV